MASFFQNRNHLHVSHWFQKNMMLGEIKKVEQDFKDITGEDGLNPTCPSWFALYHLTCILHSHLINYNLNICDLSNNDFFKNLSHMRIIEMTLKAFKVINFNLHVLDRRVDVQWCQTIISSPSVFLPYGSMRINFFLKISCRRSTVTTWSLHFIIWMYTISIR